MIDRKTTRTSPFLKFTIEPLELVEVMDEFSKLLTKIERYNPHVDKDLIKRSLRFAAIAHAGQYRKSGKPYIYHGIQTAGILADLHLDSVMIACGILHDEKMASVLSVPGGYADIDVYPGRCSGAGHCSFNGQLPGVQSRMDQSGGGAEIRIILVFTERILFALFVFQGAFDWEVWRLVRMTIFPARLDESRIELRVQIKNACFVIIRIKEYPL